MKNATKWMATIAEDTGASAFQIATAEDVSQWLESF